MSGGSDRSRTEADLNSPTDEDAVGQHEPARGGSEVSYREAFLVWCRIAALSLGGPAGQIAVMHRILVDEKRWICESRFLHALSYCMLLPGPEAQQLATYIGWLMHGTRGALTAGILFVLPGYVCIMALSILYAQYQGTLIVSAIFFGLKPAVMAVVVEAVLRIGKRVLRNRFLYTVAAVSFIMIFAFGVPFPVIIGLAALTGFLADRFVPHWVTRTSDRNVKATASANESPTADSVAENRFAMRETPVPTWGRFVRVSAVCFSLWFGPLIAVWQLCGQDSIFLEEGLFFSRAAVVTFGGAYAVLAYIAQQAVHRYQWLMPGEMMDGLGMAETTPGPLIMVVQFVGFMGAFRNPEGLHPLMAAILGATLTTWVTFVPCFYWIFLGAPYIEKLRSSRALQAAMNCITAAVLGVVLNMAVWFSMHVLFSDIPSSGSGLAELLNLTPTSFQPAAAVIALVAILLMFVLHRGLALTLSVCCVLGMLYRMVI
ncbi:MAG: chromate efflux transporter [Planctomyces sp.]